MNDICIWAPKYSSREVLIKPYQIKDGVNRIIFTKANLPNFLINSETIRGCKMVPHGRTGAYAVPFEYLSKEKTNQLSLEVV